MYHVINQLVHANRRQLLGLYSVLKRASVDRRPLNLSASGLVHAVMERIRQKVEETALSREEFKAFRKATNAGFEVCSSYSTMQRIRCNCR